MRPLQATAYVQGWDACIRGEARNGNPWRGTAGAWDRYRERAWDSGWNACHSGAKFIDPRRK